MIPAAANRASFMPRGFTLAETLLSAAVVSGALLTVVSLFSSGLSIARESTRITYSSMLARRVVEEVSLVPTEPGEYPAMMAMKSLQQPAPQENHDLRLYNAFLEQVSVSDNVLQGTDVYGQGCSDLNAVYLVRCQVLPRTDLGEGLQQLLVDVEFPATVKAAERKVHRFSTLMYQP